MTTRSTAPRQFLDWVGRRAGRHAPHPQPLMACVPPQGQRPPAEHEVALRRLLPRQPAGSRLTGAGYDRLGRGGLRPERRRLRLHQQDRHRRRVGRAARSTRRARAGSSTKVDEPRRCSTCSNRPNPLQSGPRVPAAPGQLLRTCRGNAYVHGNGHRPEPGEHKPPPTNCSC